MDKAVPTQGTRHLPISKSNPPSQTSPLGSSGSIDSPFVWEAAACQRPVSTSRWGLLDRADSRPLAGDVSNGLLSSGAACPCFKKYRVHSACRNCYGLHKQTNRCLFAQQLSRVALPVLCVQGGLRCSSPPPRLICSQLGRNQRRTAWRQSVVCPWCACLGMAEGNRLLLPTELQDVLLPSGAYWIMTRNQMYMREKGAPLHWCKLERAVIASVKFLWIYTGVKWSRFTTHLDWLIASTATDGNWEKEKNRVQGST